MARTGSILKALFTALRRDQKSLGSVVGSNFFFACALLLGPAGALIYLIIGLVLLFPLSTDPLRKIPASRLQLWPLDGRERWMLRVLSPWLNPVTWAIGALALWASRGRVTAGLWGLAAGLVGSAFFVSSWNIAPAGLVWRAVPPLPGRLGQLVRKNIREIVSTLDFYCALIVALAAMSWRLLGKPLPPEAWMMLTLLVVLAFSSYSQALFGLDGRGGLSRYRLLPLEGWQLLLAKGVALIFVVTLLTAGMEPAAGFGGALAMVALGHRQSVMAPRPQVRWRFSAGGPIAVGLLHTLLIAFAIAAVSYHAIALVACAAFWLASLVWYGRRLAGMLAE